MQHHPEYLLYFPSDSVNVVKK